MSEDGEQWRELLEKLVTEESEKQRSKVAKKLRKWIQANVSSTTQDIAVEVKEVKKTHTSENDKKRSTKENDVDDSKKQSKSQSSKKVKQSEDETPMKSLKQADVEFVSQSDGKKLMLEDDVNGDNQESEKKRFSRVDESKALQKAIVADNRYEAVFGDAGYGAKANDKLKTVRGKDFRHEKTKKKRGSYRGGAIDMDVVNSVEFDSD